MSTAQHTPGPWFYNRSIEPCLSTAPADQASDDVMNQHRAAYNGGICWTGDIGGFSKDADGILAAAAPELLEACQKMLTDLNCCGKDWEMYQTAITRMQAAIAKAEGRA